MKHISYAINDVSHLTSILLSAEIGVPASCASSILVQIYTTETDGSKFINIALKIKEIFHLSILVGASSAGSIVDGRTKDGLVVIGFSFFFSSTVIPFAFACTASEESKIGNLLCQKIHNLSQPVKAVLLLTTPMSLNASALINSINESEGDFLIFGGGAADSLQMHTSLVFEEITAYQSGVVAVVFLGEDLSVESKTYLGWRALSKEMTVTESDGLVVKSVNGKPAFDVYANYLNIKNDENFFFNSLEFPFVLKRNRNILTRVPIQANKDGSIRFLADIHTGEKFRLGYGDPSMIIQDALQIQQQIHDFQPEVIFLYTCCCRRFLMQSDIELETIPFEKTAPTFGFYTYGEIHGEIKNTQLLNSTMVAIGLREGLSLYPKAAKTHHSEKKTRLAGPYSNKHTRILSKLVHFISAVTDELEQSNHELSQLSSTDKLTQVANRSKLDDIIAGELSYAQQRLSFFALVMLDIDHFKRVNDTYGHSVGDEVLIQLAQLLLANTRTLDTVGRWGGEEFLIILPATTTENAYQVAEKLRVKIEQTVFSIAGHQTCSFGVTSSRYSDDIKNIIARADASLYKAKHAGRNKVEKDNDST